MKLHPSPKSQNHLLAYIYLGLAFAMAITGIQQKNYIWYLFSAIMIGLAAYRLYYLDQKLKN